jgi:hypothetical protein
LALVSGWVVGCVWEGPRVGVLEEEGAVAEEGGQGEGDSGVVTSKVGNGTGENAVEV